MKAQVAGFVRRLEAPQINSKFQYVVVQITAAENVSFNLVGDYGLRLNDRLKITIESVED